MGHSKGRSRCLEERWPSQATAYRAAPSVSPAAGLGRLNPPAVGAEPPQSRVSQSVQSLSRVRLCATPWTAARQACLNITNSWSLLKLMSIALVMPSNHLIFCHPLPPPLVFPSIRVFPNESVLRIRWPKCWSFSFSINPSNEYSGLISFRIG